MVVENFNDVIRKIPLVDIKHRMIDEDNKIFVWAFSESLLGELRVVDVEKIFFVDVELVEDEFTVESWREFATRTV